MDSAEYASRVDELERYLGAAFTHAEATYQRLERELHGRTSQRLVALALDLRVQEASAAAGTPEHENLRRIIGAVTEMAEDLRTIENSVFPSILSDAGLPAALRALSRRAVIRVDVHADGVGRLPLTIELAVYRATAAAIEYHAGRGAKRVEVTVTDDAPHLGLTIVADASSPDGDAGSPDDDPLGLTARGQIDAAGGRTAIERRPNGTAAVVVTFDRAREADTTNGG